VDEIVDEYSDLLTEIHKVNPLLKVVFTVSPIRHLKDGAIENQRSKAVLLLAIDKLINEFGDDYCAYFPAYEIVMDELRDYRFYAEDMIHISDMAVEHIWEKFQLALIDKESQQVAAHVQKIVKAASHRPIHKNTTEYNQFLMQMKKQIADLETKYKHLNFAAEKVYFKRNRKNRSNETVIFEDKNLNLLGALKFWFLSGKTGLFTFKLNSYELP
jgi:hypothetical protein